MTSSLVPLVLDFETFHDKAYNLKGMPTAQYVRDPRFECLGAAVATPGMPSRFFEPETLPDLFSRLPWDRILLIGHNLQFDALVLNERYGYVPCRHACTMFMARYLIAQGILDPRQATNLDALAPLVGMEKGNLEAALAEGTLAEYAGRDADITQALFERYRAEVPDDEWDHIDLHVRMATQPVFELDTDALHEMANRDKEMAETIYPRLRKDAEFVALLEKRGVEVEYKTTPKGKRKPALAKVDRFMVSLLQHPDKVVRALAELRQKAGSNLERTRAQRFLDVGSPFPAPLWYYGAHTGRASGRDSINVQNLPRKGGLRGTIKAPAGYKLVIVDSSQVEVRVNAWLAGQQDLLEEFREGRDPYLSFAAFLYGRDFDELVAEYRHEKDTETPGRASMQRQVAKAAVLALGFGQGPNGFVIYCERSNVPMDMETATQTVDAYRRRYRAIRRSMFAAFEELKATGAQVLPSGRKLTYPDLRIERTGDVVWQRPDIFRNDAASNKLWAGSAIENKVQAVARDVVFWQNARLAERWRLALGVHDEAVLVVPDAQVDEAVADALRWYSTTPPWADGLPIKGEAHIAEAYTK